MATKKKKWKVTDRWRKLSKAEQIAEIWQAMRDGHTNETAAEKLGATPGIIAGIRTRNKIPSRGNIPEEEKPAPAQPGAPAKRKLAVNEAVQCKRVDRSDGMRCAYERLPDSDYCADHQ